MGLFSKMKDLVGIEEIEDEEEEELVEAVEKTVQTNDMTRLTPASERLDSRSFSKPAEPSAPTTNTAKFTSQWKMVVIEPTDFNDSPKLVDSLKAKKPVIINLENLETDVARKIFDFLSGATYALNGNVQKVANNIFVFAPENVELSINQNQKAADSPYKSAWR